jgi:hypothetical protein
MSQELEIILKINDESARKANAAQVASLKKIQAEQAKSASAFEAANNKAAAAAESMANKAAAAQQKAAMAVVRAHEKAAEAQIAAANRAADNDLRAAMRRSAAVSKAANDAVAAAERRAAADEKADARAATSAAKASASVQAAAKKRADADVAASAKQSGGLGDIAAAVTGVGLAYAGLSAAKAIVASIGESWAAQRKDIEESVLRVTKYQEKLLELAQLKGQIGKTTVETGEQIKFRAKTLQTADQSQKFQEGLLNSGQATVKAGFMSQKEMDKLAVHAGSYQAATNADPNALGQLTGALPAIIGKKDLTADEAFRREANILKIFQEGGSSQSSAVSQFSKNAGLSTMGIFKSPEQQAGLQSLFSLTSADEAGTMVDQFTRATVGGLGRIKGVHVEGGESQAEYIKGLAKTANRDATQMDPIEIGKMIASDMAAQKTKEAKAGREFNAYDYLGQKGYTQETKMVLMDFANRQNSGQYGATFEPMSKPEAAPTLAEATKGAADFRTGDVGQDRTVGIAKDAADAIKGRGAEGFYLRARKLAFERLRADPNNGVSGEFDTWDKDKVFRGRILDESQREIMERAKKFGVTLPEEFNRPKQTGSEKLGIGGGQGPLGGAYDALIAAMDRNTDATNKAEEAAREGRAKAAGGAPPVLPAGPAGAAKRPK